MVRRHGDAPEPQRDRAWRRTPSSSLEAILSLLARLDPHDPETLPSTNLLVGLFASSKLTAEGDPGKVLGEWQTARRAIAEAC